MKKCPQCGRDYNDDSLSFCLDDGSELLFGPADEPATAILSQQTGFPDDDSPTQAQIPATDRTSRYTGETEAEPQANFGDATERQSLSAHRAAKPLVVSRNEYVYEDYDNGLRMTRH